MVNLLIRDSRFPIDRCFQQQKNLDSFFYCRRSSETRREEHDVVAKRFSERETTSSRALLASGFVAGMQRQVQCDRQ